MRREKEREELGGGGRRAGTGGGERRRNRERGFGGKGKDAGNEGRRRGDELRGEIPPRVLRGGAHRTGRPARAVIPVGVVRDLMEEVPEAQPGQHDDQESRRANEVRVW
jgi:hypothetical protein